MGSIMPMQKSGCWIFSFSPRSRKQDPNIQHHGLQHGSESSDISQTASRTNYPRKSSLRSLTQDFSSSFISCFSPSTRKISKGTAQEHRHQLDNASSTSASKVSTISSRSHIFKYSASTSTSRALPEETQFSIVEIHKSTGSFSLENMIGEGGFGTVYKGKLNDGSLVAVKRAKMNLHDKRMSSEFSSEIQILSKIEHLNLVRFLGCLEDKDEQLLVVEYVGNGTLREHLEGICGDGLEFAQRLNIAIDVAHAITYLHTYTDQPIIHRDIKSSNILLTENLRAKVADFGFARLGVEDSDATHISTGIKGTAGYLDPEYLRTYQLTEKSDVYSFGVLLVELVTGRRPIERGRDFSRNRITTRWAMQKFREGDTVLAMDPRLRRNPAAIGAAEKVMGLAYICLAPSRRSRPSMKRCAEVLWRIRREFQEAQLASSCRQCRQPPDLDKS